MHPLTQIPLKEWPDLIDDFARVIGDEAALELFIRFNGRRITIPINAPSDNHVLVQTIGAERIALLCQEYGGELVGIPNGAHLLRRIRNENIRNDFKNGMSQGDLASKYLLTYRAISTITNSQ